MGNSIENFLQWLGAQLAVRGALSHHEEWAVVGVLLVAGVGLWLRSPDRPAKPQGMPEGLTPGEQLRWAKREGRFTDPADAARDADREHRAFLAAERERLGRRSNTCPPKKEGDPAT